MSRNLEPRTHRGWTFALLRAVTNALLRDLNTALVAEEMRRGTRAIYVDYVDYDEIAHHAGLSRPESLAALDGLDTVLGALERLAESAPRPYHLVVLSDHGQSQGRSFKDRYERSLGDLCKELMGQPVTEVDEAVEGWGRAEALADDASGSGGMGRLAGQAGTRLNRQLDSPEAGEDVVVLGSGNLGLLYLPGPSRLTLDVLDERWPALVPGLAQHPGIAFVAGLDATGEPWAIGAGGRRQLRTGAVHGDDPLAGLAPHAGRALCRAVLMPEAPDLYVNSAVDPTTLDVAAFEDLVGAHGGLGGWQDRGVLLVPTDLVACLPDHVEGADELHRALVRMLRRCGHRGSVDERRGREVSATVSAATPSPR